MKINELRSNELRIGNLITVHGYLQEVCELPLPENCTEENTKPIPLTEEWLLEFGFNNDYRNGYIGIDVNQSDFVLTKPKVMGDWQNSFCFQFEAGGIHKFKEIKHVHQLQNLYFSLTGEELTIKK